LILIIQFLYQIFPEEFYLKKALREREIMLAAKETEVKLIKQSMQEKVRELEKIVQSQTKRQTGKSRLGSFLANIEKRH